MESGHFGSDDSRAWSYDANALGRRILGAPLALAAIAGVVWLGAWRRRPAAVILGSFVVGYSLIVGSWAMKAERYLLPILPASLVLAASAVTEAHGRLVELRATRPLVRVASLTLLAILFAAPLVQGLSEIRDRTRADTRTLAQEWIETHCPTGALIVSEAYGPEVRRVSDLWRAPPDLAETIRTRWQSSPYYAVQTLPLYQVRPETSGAFYDRSLYRDADLFVITSDVRDRYEREPQRFARQLAFYAELRASCSEVAEFRPDNGPGPTITIYFDPAQKIPFGYRTGVAGPSAPPQGSGAAAPEVASFLWQMGLNYELFGFLDAAVRCYDMGLAMGRLRPDALRSLAFGKARCLAAAGHLEEAVLFLGRAAEACSSPREAEALRGYRDELAREGSAPGERP
jgi:hypothetical protein